MGVVSTVVHWGYSGYQSLLSKIFSPNPPPPHHHLDGPRIAVIGAGVTGVSSAAHCIGHGCEVTLFEAGGRENLGGIWSRVNNTSSLQIHSMMYRFHPSVKFRYKYPTREQILAEITCLWKRYCLDERTKFNTPVTRVWRDEAAGGRWRVNDGRDGLFDGVIAAAGSCGDPNMPHLPGQDRFKGPMVHSSDLTGHEKEVRGKTVAIIGGGASAVEAVEFAVSEGAKESYILARSDKWIIPRNPIVDILLAIGPLGEETNLSWIPESLLKIFFYRDLADLAPANTGLFTETPMCNDRIMTQLRSGAVCFLRGDILGLVEEGVKFSRRDRGVPQGGPGKHELVRADAVILATGYHRPSLEFLPPDAFKEHYRPPNWYLQTFPVGFPDVCATNATYVSAIGTVGNFHIGIYTRILLMFVVEPATRPSEAWMRAWVDLHRCLKRGAPGGALDFFTYGELMLWFVLSLALWPRRWKWALFVLMGIGGAVKMKDGMFHGLNAIHGI
ncbi:monooxygenase [Xylariaceae sp. FL0804]|nr:monooxygenase [Xylariaceae sp. FL0804]